MTRIIKNQIPVDHDVYLKYICPNPKCCLQHWQSLRQVKVRNYKIVCECGLIIKTKQVKTIDIIYNPEIIEQSTEKTIPTPTINIISDELLNKSIPILVEYGFTKQEASDLLKETYAKNPTTECAILIKNTLESFGAKNVNTNSSVQV